MTEERTVDKVLGALRERAKELSCLYEIEELLNKTDLPLDAVISGVALALVTGMQFVDVCAARIEHDTTSISSPGFDPTVPWVLEVPLQVHDQPVGRVQVIYTQACPEADEGPFLNEEVRLLRTVADRLNHYLLFRQLREMREVEDRLIASDASSWRGPLRLIRQADRNLYFSLARKMINHLCWMGVAEAQDLLGQVGSQIERETLFGEVNQAHRLPQDMRHLLENDRPFDLAERHMSSEEILDRVQRWIQEDRASAFLNVMEDSSAQLVDVHNALRRFHHVTSEGAALSESMQNGLLVGLVRRFLSEQLDYINVAKEHVRTEDFEYLMEHLILSAGSNGRLGGKGAGLFLAHRILEGLAEGAVDVGPVRIPKTWYLASDGVLAFMRYNDLSDLTDQKYKPIDQVRLEYPNVVWLFKNSAFPAEMRKGLSLALDDLGEGPLIVRSSSLLEDRLGSAFSGKYKSLFLPNQGSKAERMEDLLDAIAEIYASTFGPDPIAYRRERGLLDFYEEMGVLIQQVVGQQVGRYFLPAFAGVAFSNNEFRWSPRIEREDGLVRLVPGLGTRAVDRTSDDYPALAVPGKPDLRVNTTLDEIRRYAPRNVDVIDLESRKFTTVTVAKLLAECGTDLPGFKMVMSQVKGDLLSKPVALLVDPQKDELIVTFDGLKRETGFLGRIRSILDTLASRLGTPVDIEFAHDGEHFYLLQCRPQAATADSAPAPIPRDVKPEQVIFSAHRYVSNGWVPDITHIVYVDPNGYAQLGSQAELLEVGTVIGQLNKLLPKRQFVLMGPGRWGSRGDVKLGVSVTYADICNTAVLIEIAQKKGGYLPDLSFGTHFFQDLVESNIRYLPLYPGEGPARFNEVFLTRSKNLLSTLLPDHARLEGVVRVIDVPAVAAGRILRIQMNADLNEALALLSKPGESPESVDSDLTTPSYPGDFWRWRFEMAERIAAELDPVRLGVRAFYLFGSVKNATAGPASDIDLLIHVEDDETRQADLRLWLDGWSRCLDEMNYLKTGYRSGGLLDVHLLTDADIARKTSFAVKIGAVTDAARPLKMKGA